MARPDAEAEETDEGPGRRRLYHHGNLREALVEATCKLIEEKGPLGFTTTPPFARRDLSSA